MLLRNGVYRSVDDIELGARLVFGKMGDDFDPAPLPYRDPQMPATLRFGFYLSGACLARSCSAVHVSRLFPIALRDIS